MIQSTATTTGAVRDWILSKHPERRNVAADEDLIESRLVDSLSFVEFIFVIEQVSGVEIDIEHLNLDDLRTLAALEKKFDTR
jgi:acyl carrier protein